MLELTIKIKDIDYKSTIETLKPIIDEKMNEEAFWKKWLVKGGIWTVKKIPQHNIDAIIAKVINSNSDKIVQALCKEVTKKNINVTIESILAKYKKDN